MSKETVMFVLKERSDGLYRRDAFFRIEEWKALIQPSSNNREAYIFKYTTLKLLCLIKLEYERYKLKNINLPARDLGSLQTVIIY